MSQVHRWRLVFLLPSLLCSTAYAASASCTVRDVATFPERVHVHCFESYNNISYFAAPTSNTSFASLIQSMASTALAGGKKLAITYDPSDLSGSAFGCGTANCRPILNILILQ
jgi:hypothetical protein